MATPTFFHQFKEDLAKGVHQFGTHTFKVALCAAASAPVTTNSVLADLTEISYTNLSSRTLTGGTAEHTTGTVPLVFDDLVLTASGGAVATFRYIVVWNDTPTSPADPLVCFYDYGTNVTLADTQQFTINFGASGLGTISG